MKALNTPEQVKPGRYVTGTWSHIFGAGTSNERGCRIVYDRQAEKLVSLEIEDGVKGWVPASEAERADVENSLKHANEEALTSPETWGLQTSDSLPDWGRGGAERKVHEGPVSVILQVPVTTNAENATSESIRAAIQQLIDAGLADASATLENDEGDVDGAQFATDLNIGAPIVVGTDNARKLEEKRIDAANESRASLERYVIRSASEGELDLDGNIGAFWSNKDGWGSLENATRFTTWERMDSFLPISSGGDSEWMLIDEALDLSRKVVKSPSVVALQVTIPAQDPKHAAAQTYTTAMRVDRLKQALLAWHAADESSDDVAEGSAPDEHGVICLLADLRHYCDANSLDFARLDRSAYADYLEQRENQRFHDSPSP